MEPTVLHVEDEPLLASLVRLAFADFGFEGQIVGADTIASALDIIGDIKRRGEPLDLIITDLKLPDGSGLKLVRRVKANPAWAVTPIIVLSSEVDRRKINKAYVLGANTFLAKSADGRDVFDVLKSLYDYWLESAVLPESGAGDRVRGQLAVAAAQYARRSACYGQVAKELVRDERETELWLTLTLRTSNQANLCGFLETQLRDVDVSSELVDRLEALQRRNEERISALEDALAKTPSFSAREVYEWSVDFVSDLDFALLADTLAQFFPRVPVATRALRESVLAALEQLVEGGPIYARSPELRSKVAKLRVLMDLFKSETDGLDEAADEG